MSETIALGRGREFDVIRDLVRRWGDSARGIGDDAAILDVPAGCRLLASTDATQLWLGLLPPNSKDGSPGTGYKSPAAFGVPFAKVIGVGP